MQTEFLMRIRAEFDVPRIIAGTPLGARRILSVKRGGFAGPGLEGTILPGSGDWVLVRPDGVAELDIRFTLGTGDGALIYMRCAGIFDASPEVMERIRTGEEVPASAYYFRTSAVFETGAPTHLHLNRLIALGVGERTPTGMVTEVFAVR